MAKGGTIKRMPEDHEKFKWHHFHSPLSVDPFALEKMAFWWIGKSSLRMAATNTKRFAGIRSKDRTYS
jgi:hypothetical protein